MKNVNWININRSFTEGSLCLRSPKPPVQVKCINAGGPRLTTTIEPKNFSAK